MIPTDVKANKNNNELFQKKKPNRGRVEDILFFKYIQTFLFFYFTPGNSRKNKAPSLEIPQIFVTPLGNSKAKNQESWKFYIIFSCSHQEIPYPQPPPPTSIPPLFGFFWNSPINKRSGGSILQFLVRRTASKVEI